jgi:hypothetical protein
MTIVDMRLRPPLKSWVKHCNSRAATIITKLDTSGRRRRGRNRRRSAAEMDEARVQWGVIMGRQSEEPLGVIPNDEIAACFEQHPDRFVGGSDSI